MPRSSAYFSVRTMKGAADTKRIKRELDTLPGVTSVSVSQSDRCVAVDFDPTGVNQEQIGQKLTSLGFEIAEVRDRFR